MTSGFKKLRKTHIISLITAFYLVASANEPCADVVIPKNRSINLSIKRQPLDDTEAWTIKGAFVVDKTADKTFEAAKKFERLQQAVPFMNIFRLSEDRKKLQCGIKLFPGLSFQQGFQIDVLEKSKLIDLQFTEGSFTGLRGLVCFSTINENQTAVILTTTGNLADDPLPFFITNSILERISKSVLRRWRHRLESEE